MAKIRNDILLQVLSGPAGQGLAGQMNAAGRPIVIIPLTTDEKIVLSRAQVHVVVTEARTQDGIPQKIEGVLQPEYMVQTVDLFRGLEIREVDPSNWHGDVGQVIRVHAPAVKQIMVMIADGEGSVIEQGAARRLGEDLWSYMTMAPATDGPCLIVTARTLPEHLVEIRFGE